MKYNHLLTERNLLIVLAGILILTTIIDIYTAFSSPIFEEAELNPLYVLTGSKIPPLILTVILTTWIIRNLKTSISLYKIFTFSLLAIYLIAGHIFGIYSNTVSTQQYLENPEEVTEYLKQNNESTEQKLINSFMALGLIMFIPFMFSSLAFFITVYFFNKRKGKRSKIMDEIYNLSNKLRK